MYLKRYRILNVDFDARATILTQDIKDDWEEHVKELHRGNKGSVIAGLKAEFGDRFLRIHRNCLVSMSHLQALEKNTSGQPCIRLRGVPETLDVSRRHVAKVRQIMS